MSTIQKKIDSWEIDYGNLSESAKIYIKRQISDYLTEISITSDKKFAAAARSVGYSENFIELVRKEKQFRSAQKRYRQYQEWVKNRNPKRAEMERKYLFDLKHGAHLIRLTKMCQEILQDGQVNVWREDAEELKCVLQGGWTYEDLLEFAEKQDRLMDTLYHQSSLPDSPDIEKINNLCIKIVETVLEEDNG